MEFYLYLNLLLLKSIKMLLLAINCLDLQYSSFRLSKQNKRLKKPYLHKFNFSFKELEIPIHKSREENHSIKYFLALLRSLGLTL